MGDCVNWLFGRGASIACNLRWEVPVAIQALPRDECIARIKTNLVSEMNGPAVDVSPYCRLLEELRGRTEHGWSHRFMTTNWDFLLQRTILELNLRAGRSWLKNAHVGHLNGTIEELEDNSQRSSFVLESDTGSARTPSHELVAAIESMQWDFHFVVIGMSFECEGDKFLLGWLNSVEDCLPIGKSKWLVLDPCKEALQASCSRIQSALPRATVYDKCSTLEEWVESGMPAFVDLGVFST